MQKPFYILFVVCVFIGGTSQRLTIATLALRGLALYVVLTLGGILRSVWFVLDVDQRILRKLLGAMVWMMAWLVTMTWLVASFLGYEVMIMYLILDVDVLIVDSRGHVTNFNLSTHTPADNVIMDFLNTTQLLESLIWFPTWYLGWCRIILIYRFWLVFL